MSIFATCPHLRPGSPANPIVEVPKIRKSKVPFYEEPNKRDPLLDIQAEAAQGSDRSFDMTLLNFDGQGFSGVNPPDTVGDVGINYYIQGINNSGGTLYTIYNKVDGSVAAGPFSLDALSFRRALFFGFRRPDHSIRPPG